MGLIPPELSLDCRPTFIPKTISQLLGDLSAIGDVLERLLKLGDFVKRLEDEMRKIDAFKRELPLCMLLLNDAIGILKEEAMQCKKLNAKPVLEEFIPINKGCDDEEEKDDVAKEKDGRDKMNWMSSVQLWNSDHSHNFSVNHSKQPSVEQIEKRNREENLAVIDDAYESCKSRNVGRAFMPFKSYSVIQVAAGTDTKEAKDEMPAAGLSLVTPGIKNPREELVCSSLSSKTGGSRGGSSSGPCVQSNSRSASQSSQQQTTRKQRRCWSPELHRRFVNALHQLGGSQAATPKQIRELMQVDGLTNDEVKSHLQKYRLHTRRVPPTHSGSTNQPLAVLGNLWGTQEQYGESLKPSPSQSGSPQGPLHLVGITGGTSTTGADSMEDEEDKRSESSYSWKSHLHTSGKDDI